MASQPSVYNEERNRLRLRAWEQRNQETSQTKDLGAENVPLFGEPYKTNKGDELSSRIQRMLGSYEDVNNTNQFSSDPSPSPYATFSQSDCPPDQSTKPSFHPRIPSVTTQSQKDPSANSYSSLSVRTSSASSSPHTHGPSSTVSKASLNPSQGSQLCHLAHEQKKSEAFLDPRDRISLPTEASAQSLEAKSLEFLHSSDHEKADTDAKGTVDGHQLQGPMDNISASSSTMDVATLKNKQSPKDASLPDANKTKVLPSQTFPPLLSSKQPSVVMTQKPTAYVRPMDGQDQVVSESPDLKPSPEPYQPLPDLINKADQGKLKLLPQFFETKTNEAQCVEDILREMTHSWPPLLTAIHTPTDEPSKSPLSSKEAEHVSSCPGKKHYDFCPRDSSQLNQQNSSFSLEAAHSSGVESGSSSDSESSSRSESDSDSAAEEPPQPTRSSSVKTEADAPAASHGDWQLWNWMRSNQQSSSTESQEGALVSKSPAHKQPVPIQSSSVDVLSSVRESTLRSQQKHLNDNVAKTQQCNESSQDKYSQPSCQESPSVESCNTNSSKQAKAECPDDTEAALGVKCEEAAATRVKEPCLTDRSKGKMKTKHSKKSKPSGDGKRTLKHTALNKRKTDPEPEPKVTLVLYSHCQSCGVRDPNSCPCSIQSHAQTDRVSPVPAVNINSSKVRPEPTCNKSTKLAHKTTIHKHSEKPGHLVKGSTDVSSQPRSLLVKIELSLLSRVPKTSRSHQETPKKPKASAAVTEQAGGDGDTSAKHKRSKASKKSNPQNAEVDHKSHPRKKQKLENKNTSSSQGSAKLERLSNPAEEQKKTKKNHVQSQQPASKDSRFHKHGSGETQEPSKDPSKHKKKSGKQTERPHVEKQKTPKSSFAVPPASQPSREASTCRPLLTFENRQYPVKHYIKEAKRLKHKADAEMDKLSKAFTYLDAAMFFVESGIAMEKDPQISMSSCTMYADTVELLKFILKLKNPVEPSTPPSEKDFLALCLRCQSLLQMAMFRHKQKTALEYSKTLTDHFNAPHNPSILTSRTTSSPVPSLSSPSGPGFSHSVAAGGGSAQGLVCSAAAVPRAIEQVTFTYVNITTLFLNAHDIWEQAEELAQGGTGALAELDAVMGPLSLTSTMSFMVRYTRQGVHWLRQDSQKVK